MGDLLITNIENQVLESLSVQAALQGSKLEDYAREILSSKVRKSNSFNRNEFIRKVDRFCELVGPQKTDSTHLIREDRDGR